MGARAGVKGAKGTGLKKQVHGVWEVQGLVQGCECWCKWCYVQCERSQGKRVEKQVELV